MTDMIKFEPKEEKINNFIKVIGVGGGGSNAVNHMFSEGIQGVDFILCNTDYQALEKSSVPTKVHLGKRILGAGNIPAEGRSAALETIDELREMLSKDTKMVFITAGMGGGTGTGAAPVVASIARELNILTVGIVTLPFAFEGKRRKQQALDGIADLRNYVDALLVISNDKLRTEYGNMKLSEAFKKADDVLKTAAKGIAEIITVSGYVNVDFKDVNTVMRGSGKAIMGSGYAEGENRAMAAAEMAVHSPLLDDSDIRGAKNILVYVTSGENEVSLDEVTEIVEYIQDETGQCSDVIWGNGEDLSLGGGIGVTLIATGFEYDEYASQGYDAQPKRIHGISNPVEESKPFGYAKPAEPEVKTIETEITMVEQEEKIVEPEIKIISKRNEEPQQPAKNVREENKIVHSLGEETNDEPLERNYNEPQNPTRDSGGDREIKSENIITVRKHDNPFKRDDDDEIVIKSYPKDSVETQTIVRHEVQTEQKNDISQQERLRRERLASLTMNYKSMSNIEKYENQPAYMRRGVNISMDNQEQELSKLSFNRDNGISENNLFLHDNID